MRIESGITRKVFIFKQFVIKIPIMCSLFKGISANWSEFVFYRKNRFQLFVLAPTYFSLLGFLNIQMYCEPLKIDAEKFIMKLDRISDGTAFWKETNILNFGMDHGKIKMIDYAHTETQKFLSQYGVKIFSKFDFSSNNPDLKEMNFVNEAK